jgi:hypothetical protein
VLQQRRLSHPGLADEHERLAFATGDALDHPIEHLTLAAASS